MKAALQTLSSSLDGELFYDDLHKMLYATDASVYRALPLAVAYPKDDLDIKLLIAFAKDHNTSLIPRTAGTSLAGQCVGEGIVVDVSRYFTQILELDQVRKQVRLQPGVIRDELNQYLEPYGLFFGPNTSTSNRCMIGGMVGNNSSGTTSIQYGVTRDKVVELKCLLSTGESCTFGAKTKEEYLEKASGTSHEAFIYKWLKEDLSSEVLRNKIKEVFPKPEIHRRNTGYALDTLADSCLFTETDEPVNLCELLTGSEGTLAFTTEITLQLDDLPPAHSAMVTAHYSDLSECLKDVITVMEHNLYTCELIDDKILNCTRNNILYDSYRDFVKGQPKAVLLLELKHNDQEVLEKNIKDLLTSLQSTARSYHLPVLRDDEIFKALELRKAGLGLLGNMIGDGKAVACVEDTAVALPDLSDFIADFTALMDRYDQHAVYYAHAGAGELHLRPILNLKKAADVKLFRQITREVAMLTKKYQGSFSGEHGDGIVRGEFLPELLGPEVYKALIRVKDLFDPDNIFNPGKIVHARKMDDTLRYEPDREEPQLSTFMDFDDSEGILRLAEKCNGSGDCRKTAAIGGTMCPSYQATKLEKDTTRARANVLREVLTHADPAEAFNSEELNDAFKLCLSCKACTSECPSNVDMATAKAEFLYQFRKHNGSKLSDKLFAFSTKYNRKAAKFPGFFNAVTSLELTSGLMKNIIGVSKRRRIPRISSFDLNKLDQNTIKETVNKKLYLFIDEFSNYLDGPIANDAFELLVRLGYDVEVITDLDSGRAMISKGFLEEAQIEADKNIEFLKDRISEHNPLIGIEPSAILTFRDEYSRLAANKEAAHKIAENTFLVEEFLASEIKKNNISTDQFTSDPKTIKIHVHCHQKALSNQKVTFDLLNFPKNYNATLINSGCCGMAGSFGYEKDNYEISMSIGELRLFPAIRKADPYVIISANGTSCRHQIYDGTNKEALHPVSILRRALIII